MKRRKGSKNHLHHLIINLKENKNKKTMQNCGNLSLISRIFSPQAYPYLYPPPHPHPRPRPLSLPQSLKKW